MKFLRYILSLAIVAFLGINPHIQAGSGKSFGLFAGGVGAGIIGTKIFSGRGERNQPTYVVQQQPQPQVIYVQQPAQPQVVYVPVNQAGITGAQDAKFLPPSEVASKAQAESEIEQAEYGRRRRNN